MKKSALLLVLRFAFLLSILKITSAYVAAQNYSFQTVDPPWITPDTGYTQFVWINNNGMIAVQYQQPIGSK